MRAYTMTIPIDPDYIIFIKFLFDNLHQRSGDPSRPILMVKIISNQYVMIIHHYCPRISDILIVTIFPNDYLFRGRIVRALLIEDPRPDSKRMMAVSVY